MNNMKTWALSAFCFVVAAALVATAYTLIPDGQSQQPSHALQSNINHTQK